VNPTSTRRIVPCCSRWLAWLVLLMVGLGWNRAAVVCNRPCCDGHVKLAPSCDARVAAPAAAAQPKPVARGCACCQRRTTPAHPAMAIRSRSPAAAMPALPAGERRHTDRSGCDGCDHLALGVGLGEPPQPPELDAGPPAWSALLQAAAGCWPHGASPSLPPPATGPPHPDRWRQDRRTVQLLL
jgi:hypothetical protein